MCVPPSSHFSNLPNQDRNNCIPHPSLYLASAKQNHEVKARNICIRWSYKLLHPKTSFFHMLQKMKESEADKKQVESEAVLYKGLATTLQEEYAWQSPRLQSWTKYLTLFFYILQHLKVPCQHQILNCITHSYSDSRRGFHKECLLEKWCRLVYK